MKEPVGCIGVVKVLFSAGIGPIGDFGSRLPCEIVILIGCSCSAPSIYSENFGNRDVCNAPVRSFAFTTSKLAFAMSRLCCSAIGTA